jgi:outer membrane protein TolC
MLDTRTGLIKLTGMALDEPVPMAAKAEIIPEKLVEVQKSQKDVAAAEKEVLARRAARYPTLSVYGAVSGNDGEAYNTNDHIYRSYNFAGLVLSVPLFDKTLTADEDIARVQLKKARKQLEDIQLELTSLEANLKEKLPIIDRSLQLAEKSVQNDEQLLGIAKVAYDSGRMTSEEYLRYESQVLASQATLNKAVDDRWQIVARQAVLYGVDLRGVVQ